MHANADFALIRLLVVCDGCSHILCQRRMGSYIHLTRPQTRFFDSRCDKFFSSPSSDGADPQWISRYQTELDLTTNNLKLKTDIFRLTDVRQPKNWSLVGDCEVVTRSLTTANGSGQPENLFIVHWAWIMVFGKTHYTTIIKILLYNTATIKTYIVRPMREPIKICSSTHRS